MRFCLALAISLLAIPCAASTLPPDTGEPGISSKYSNADTVTADAPELEQHVDVITAESMELAATTQDQESISMQTPTIGRIVHYQAHGSPDGTHKAVPRAAIITQVHNDKCVDLCVLNPTGMYFNTSTVLDESDAPKGGTWHWPPRTEPVAVKPVSVAAEDWSRTS